LADHLGVDTERAIWFDSRTEQLDLDRAAVLPLLGREGGYHPLASVLFAEFAARVAVPSSVPTPRLFVARGTFSNPAAPKRVLVNEAELAEIAAREFGFSAVHPETLGFSEQVGLFAQARTILGQAGSGMHNALFAPEGATVGVIRFTAPDQSHIAALRRQRIGYLTEGVAETAPGVFHADAGRFRRFVNALIEP
ncbi:MAG TPA: glycosyltransferase family 61 protein, partial [Acidiphilium sp.]